MKYNIKNIKHENKFLLIYIVIGSLWILFSDKLVFLLFDTSEHITIAQTLKGWFYVFFSGVLFFYIIKSNNNKLRESEKKAKENDNLKSAFLQNISHEIRTPMNGILGFSEILSKTNIGDKKIYQYTDFISQSTRQLLLIINDIIEMSMLDAKSVIVYRENFELNEMLQELERVAIPMKVPNVNLTLEIPSELNNIYLNTDKTKLRQIIYNLLNNACKYTHKGEIVLGYNIDGTYINIFVKDTGIGIDKEMHTKIFEKFRQAEVSMSRQYGGTGLGLSIAKEIVELLGFKLQLDSEVGEGAVFTLKIPIENIVIGKNEEIQNNSKFVENQFFIVEENEIMFEYINELFDQLNLDINKIPVDANHIENILTPKMNNIILINIDYSDFELFFNLLKLIENNNNNIKLFGIATCTDSLEKNKNKNKYFSEILTIPFNHSQLLSALSKHISI